MNWDIWIIGKKILEDGEVKEEYVENYICSENRMYCEEPIGRFKGSNDYIERK